MVEFVYKFEHVVWVDAEHGPGEWHTTDALPSASQVQSNGWISMENDAYIVLSGSRYWMHGEVFWGQSIALPKSMIVSRTPIQVEGLHG